MSDSEELIDVLLTTLADVRQMLAIRAAELGERDPALDVVSGLEVPGRTKPALAIAGFVEVRVGARASVWYVRIERHGKHGWTVARTIERYDHDADADREDDLPRVTCPDSRELAEALPGLVGELLATPAWPFE